MTQTHAEERSYYDKGSTWPSMSQGGRLQNETNPIDTLILDSQEPE